MEMDLSAVPPRPVPAPRRAGSGPQTPDEAKHEKVEVFESVECVARSLSKRNLVTCSIIMAQYVSTAAVVHEFAYRRDNIAGFNRSHYGVLRATPLIVTAALYSLWMPRVRLVFGLAAVMASEIALIFLEMDSDDTDNINNNNNKASDDNRNEWRFYGPLLAHLTLGLGIHLSERALEPLCHSKYRLLPFFAAIMLQPLISGYIDDKRLSPLVMAAIVIPCLVLQLYLERFELKRFPLSSSRSLGVQLCAFSCFYLIWGKLATVKFLVELVELEKDSQPLLFLTFGACALIVCFALKFVPASWRSNMFYAAIPLVTVGLVIDSDLVLEPEVWSVFIAKALLGAGLALTVGIIGFVSCGNSGGGGVRGAEPRWMLCSVGGLFGIVVSTFIADRHDHYVVNIIDLAVYLLSAAILVAENLLLRYRGEQTAYSVSETVSKL